MPTNHTSDVRERFNFLRGKVQKKEVQNCLARQGHSSVKIGKTVYNMPDRDLVPELLVLEKGLKFAVISKKLPILETKVAMIENFAQKFSIRDQVMRNKTQPAGVTEKVEQFRFRDPTSWNFPPKKFINKDLKSCGILVPNFMSL